MNSRPQILTAIALLLAVCLASAGFLAERAGADGLRLENEQLKAGNAQLADESSKLTEERDEALAKLAALQSERDALSALNRSSVSNMSADGTIYVIGHKSPDSDTVVSAIAYARLLRLLGYDADARVTMPVSNETAYILREAGAEAPPVLEDASGENIFLVDHSEYLQAAEGMEDAHVVGVLDHHGVGTLTTGHQIVYEARPIGATATIVWLDYLNYGLEIDRSTAHLLLGAVLSDTSNLTGTTTIDADRAAVSALAELAGVDDVDAFYRQIHAESLSYEGFTDKEILFSDYKEYEAGGMTFGIGIVNAIDETVARDLAARMKGVIDEGLKERGVDMIFASVGIRENGEKTDFIVPAEGLSQKMFEACFTEHDGYDGTSYVFRDGLGRKTKFVPPFTDFLNAHPHE